MATVFTCPNCGVDLPQQSKSNELLKCPACHATLLINDWKIDAANGAVAIQTSLRNYVVRDLLMRDDLANVYRCTYKLEGADKQALFRLARDPFDNDLIKNEAQILFHLQGQADYEHFKPFYPIILESFTYQDVEAHTNLQVNILGFHERIESPNELYTLEEVHHYYGQGVHPADMAWMWRRILNALGFVHQAGVVHGSVLPHHILIEPRDHKVILIGFSFAVRNSYIPAMSLTYETWYPQAVLAKHIATPSTDIVLAARTMLYVMGFDPLQVPTHPRLEPSFQSYFAKCLQGQTRQTAWELLEEFDRLLEGAWGERTFREFRMPAK